MTEYIEPDVYPSKKKHNRESSPYFTMLLVISLFTVAGGIWLLWDDVFSYNGIIPEFILKLALKPFELFFLVFIVVIFIPVSLICRERRWWVRLGILGISFILYFGVSFSAWMTYGQLLGVQLHTQINYQRNVYYLVSTSDIFTYEQYTVYRCGESYRLCQRVLEPLTVDTLVDDFYIPSLNPTYSEFFVEDYQLYLKLADQWYEQDFAIPMEG